MAHATHDVKEFKKIQTAAFFALLLGVGWLFYKLIAPYVFALFWAAVLAALFYPLYQFFQRRLRHDSGSALVTLLIIMLIFVLPLVLVLGLIINQAVVAYNHLSAPETFGSFQVWADQTAATHPLVAKLFGDIDIDQKIQTLSQTASSVGFEWVRIGSQSTAVAVLLVFIILYATFFFLKDGGRLLRHIMHLLPFGDANETILFNKFVSTAKATLRGTILIGMIQGSIGGVVFWLAGVPAPAFWGMVMTIASIVPAIGSSIIWAPAGVIMLLLDNTAAGIIILVGGLFISVIDNFIRPVLVGRNIQMHPLLILLSTLGGIALFGISGFVAGPMIAALFLAILQMYETKYQQELDSSDT